MDASVILTFIIVAFSLGLILIMTKDRIPPQFRRGLAIVAIIMVTYAFFLILYSLFTLGN